MPGSIMNPNFISSVFIMAGVLRIKEGIKNPFIAFLLFYFILQSSVAGILSPSICLQRPTDAPTPTYWIGNQ